MANLQRWTRIARWFMTSVVLFAVPSAVSVLLSGLTPANLGVVFGFVGWATVWIWLWQRVVGRDHTGEVVGLLANTILLSLFTVIAPTSDNSFLVFVFIVAGVIFPTRQALWAFAVLAALQLGLAMLRLTDVAITANLLINSIVVGVLGMGARLFYGSYVQLVAAREQLAHLAVTEERLRFARDLHDLLGQSLSVLVLKSELVSKQLPADADENVRGEVRDIAHVARKSLNDVREAVSSYRQPTLQAEISNARSVLRAAGIGLVVQDRVGSLPPEQDGVLAWCLREAVTNVVKHSGAKKCEVHLSTENGSAELEVVDDGRGAPSLDAGSGLDGMRERVEMVGGALRLGSQDAGGMRVVVTVPRPS